MRAFKRSQRIADQIQRDVAEIIAAMMQDRAGPMVTVSAAEVTDDLRYAKIFYTVLGDSDNLERVKSTLDRSTGHIQSELAHRLPLRRVPEISFHYDEALVKGMRIISLIDSVTPKPEEVDARMRQQIIDSLLGAKHVLVTAHKGPDGDSIGSQLGLAGFLKAHEIPYVIVNEGPIPDKYRFLPGIETIHDIEHFPIPQDRFDAAVVIECSSLDRIGQVQKLIDQDCMIINIDHHQDNVPFGAINLKKTDAAAAGEMIYDILLQGSFAIDQSMATNLYAAILTDTGRFHYTNTTPSCMRAAAHLLELGADAVEVTEKVYFNLKPQVVKLTGRVVGDMEFELDGRLCLLTVDQKTLAEAHVDNGDIEGLVNYTLYARGVEVGALFTELSAEKTKVSFRSHNDLDVAAIAAHFGGGGHINASGCIVDMPLRETRETIIRYIKDRLNGSV